MNRNLINGHPLEFGNREQIKLIRKANELYTGEKPVAKVEEQWEFNEFSVDDEDEPEEDFSHQYVQFNCIQPGCRQLNRHNAYGYPSDGYFRDGHTFQCWSCKAMYEIRENECFHLPEGSAAT